MGKLEGKVAVITAATSGMALATAKLFVEEGAYVFITGRRKDKLDEAVKLIGRNVTGVQGDASNLADVYLGQAGSVLLAPAATLMTSAPLLVAFLLFQRQFVQSFMRAGIR